MNDQDCSVNCIAIISPGDMGHAVGRTLVNRGLDVITCLTNRSPRTRSLAERAGIRDVESLDHLVRQADLVLSILVPDRAIQAAAEFSRALRSTDRRPFYADCNAVSPQTANDIGRLLDAECGRYIDASIIGMPPGAETTPRVYVSGPDHEVMSVLQSEQLEVTSLGSTIGKASSIKMCYAALTKGMFALHYAVAIAGERMEVFDALCDELEFSQSRSYELMQRHLPRLPAKAFRWIGEMRQIADTLEHNDLPRGFHDAAAEIYGLINQTPLARETPETIDVNRTLKETIRTISST